MSAASWLQIGALVAALGISIPFLGNYMATVFGGGTAAGDRVFGPAERLMYRLTGVNPEREQRWPTYAGSILAFSAVSILVLYLLQRVQGSLPFNPTDAAGVPPALAFNTAVSFVTNTNWQNYAAENTMSHLTQMVGLAVQNFVSAAVGLAVAVALIRGLVRKRSATIGNFWVDLTRGVLRVLLPIAFVAALVLVSQGVLQNLGGFEEATTLEGAPQVIPGGPAASQEAIKELGTNGGGYLNANSAHPLGNPNGLTDLFEIYLLLVIPFSLAWTFGKMAGDRKQGLAILGAMVVLWAASVGVATGFEVNGNPELEAVGVTQETTDDQSGGNLEGKEVRFGPSASALFAASTTGTSTGAVNSAHDSFTPGGGAVPLVNMMLGEVSPGGVGAGLYGMLIFAILAVFIAGLMVGRTPEYLGKKIQAAEMKLVVLYMVIVPVFVLGLTGISVVMDSSASSILNAGPHGLSEVTYAFTSASNNNGSAFGGLTGNTDWYNSMLGLAMLAGRFLLIVPALAIAGSLGRKQRVPASAGTFPTGTPLFAALLIGVVLIVVGLTYFPVLSLGPVVEQLALKGTGVADTKKLLDPQIVRVASVDSLRKLDPRLMARNPVMFVVLVGSVLTTILFFRDLGDATSDENVFAGLVAVWLWFTVLFANFAEAVAEGRGKAQAETLRKARSDTMAHRRAAGGLEEVASSLLRVDDVVEVSAGEIIPSDGEIVEGIASVDESAITGESAPVIRESGGDRSAVTGGTRVLSDHIVVRITAKPGETFLDRMIALVEGASRQKTPNEIALNILLAGLTIIFLLTTVTLQPFAIYSGGRQDIIVLVALLVCLIPTTIGALLSAIGIAGMDRLVQHNVLAMSGRAVEAAGDCSTLLLDKTGTITLGNRQAAEFIPLAGVDAERLASAAQFASLADETPEGRSIVVLAKQLHGLRERDLRDATLVPFTAQTRMSGVDQGGSSVRKGAADSIRRWVGEQGGTVPGELDGVVERVATGGGTPLVVAENTEILGVIHLKDVVKEGMIERFDQLRALGIRTVMITGDNPLTAKAIADEAGVDDFLAEATPEDKMALIRAEQQGGRMVAMTGDGTNDAPALAQADVGVAMNTGTQAAKEAGNMVDLDSNPTKLIEVVEIGKQLLITRGSLTTFSIANDVAKYFAIIPAMFVGLFPQLDTLNVMALDTPRSAILSAVIFNALIIVALIPLALRGVRFRAKGAAAVFRRNLLVYGVGGLITPFVGIKAIDLVITALGVS